jgi:hypothetical protein
MSNNGCRLQEWYVQVEDCQIKYERPICKQTGYRCLWSGEECKCNHYEAKGEAKK